MNEIWKPIAGYENLYEVSNLGNVRSLFRYKRHLKPSISSGGYLSVELLHRRFLVHRLVADAFIPNPDSKLQVNHKDENKQNNCADNLEWCTAKYNMNYGEAAKTRHSKIDYTNPVFADRARKNGAKVSKPVLQFSKDGVLIGRYVSGKEAHRKTGINHSHILECCAGKRYKTVGGFVWKYDERNDDLLVSRS
jgi:hypothetical protein